LLALPGVEVNPAAAKKTPVMLAAYHGSNACLRLLLEDPRVDVTLRAPRIDDCYTALELAISRQRLDTVKWFLALRSPAENVFGAKCMQQAAGFALSHIEWPPGATRLMEDYQREPLHTRLLVRLELGLPTAAYLFAATVLLSDGFLRIRPPSPPDDLRIPTGVRFPRVSTRLPMELQMVLASRAMASPKDVVLQREFDAAVEILLLDDV